MLGGCFTSEHELFPLGGVELPFEVNQLSCRQFNEEKKLWSEPGSSRSIKLTSSNGKTLYFRLAGPDGRGTLVSFHPVGMGRYIGALAASQGQGIVVLQISNKALIVLQDPSEHHKPQWAFDLAVRHGIELKISAHAGAALSGTPQQQRAFMLDYAKEHPGDPIEVCIRLESEK